jgi:hypothetical protein
MKDPPGSGERRLTARRHGRLCPRGEEEQDGADRSRARPEDAEGAGVEPPPGDAWNGSALTTRLPDRGDWDRANLEDDPARRARAR